MLKSFIVNIFNFESWMFDTAELFKEQGKLT